jgi:hypothetical protein
MSIKISARFPAVAMPAEVFGYRNPKRRSGAWI